MFVCRYAVRVEAMQLSLEFKEKVADIQPAIATLDTAMEELLACEKLIELFHVALIAGNVINGVRNHTHLFPLSLLLLCSSLLPLALSDLGCLAPLLMAAPVIWAVKEK